MFDKFIPDLMVDDIYCIDTEPLIKRGISLLIFDIDNTLAPYETLVPDEKLFNWLMHLKENGFQVAFLSNNKNKRVEDFNEKLMFFAIADAKKPSTKSHRKVLSHFQLKPENTAVIGDQIFTDIYSGKVCGMYTILVPPIKDKKSLFFRMKRVLEKPFIYRYKKNFEKIK